MSKEILLTGSHGFIGNHLIRNLQKKDYHFKILDHNITPYKNLNKLTELLKDIDVVIHLGGKVYGDSKELRKANIESTIYLLEAISKLKTQPLFIFSSTFAVYKTQDKLLDENTAAAPRDMYGETKLEAEKNIQIYSIKYKFPSLIFRISNVYGPDMPPYSHSVIATFFHQIANELPLTINSNGEQERDFVYIDDVISAMMLAIKWKGKPGQVEVVNICSGEPISINRVAKEIIKISGIKINANYPKLNEIEKGVWIGNNEKAKKLLSWLPKITFEKGIRMYYEKKK